MCRRTDLESYPPPDRGRRPDTPEVPSTAIKSKWTGTLPDKIIAALVTLVSQTNISNWVNTLSNFHTRHTKSVYIDQVANWLVAEFTRLGYVDVAFHEYTEQGYQLKNVVCTKPGRGNTGQITVICGHYDCIMEDHNDSGARAPGANDNASGIAAMLEMARILKDVDIEDEVRFLCFSGEEQGFWGSKHYAQYCLDNNINVHRLINLDMIGYPSPNFDIKVERDMGNSDSTNDQDSQDFGNLMAQMALDYTNMSAVLAPIYGSDYMPFEKRGYVVIGAYETGENPAYHNSDDTPDDLNYSYIADVTKMALATLLIETAAVIDESTSSIDVYIRDNTTDNGNQPSTAPHWKSPDIWVRNNPPDTPAEDPEEGHQPPINAVPNYMYVRIHKRGSQPASGLSVNAYHCNPGTGMIWPDHFNHMGTLAIQGTIAPNGSARVGPFVWTPHIEDHECLLAIVSGPQDHAIPDVYSGKLDHSVLVRYDNNVGQRNVSPENSVLGGKTKTAFIVRGATYSSVNKLILDAGAMPSDTKIEMRISRSIKDSASGMSGFTVKSENSLWCYLIEITAVKETEDYIYGNKRTRELHKFDCIYFSRMKQSNKTPFPTVEYGLARGYNGCAYCLPKYDSD